MSTPSTFVSTRKKKKKEILASIQTILLFLRVMKPTMHYSSGSQLVVCGPPGTCHMGVGWSVTKTEAPFFFFYFHYEVVDK